MMRRDFYSELLNGIDHPETYYCRVWECQARYEYLMLIQLKSDPAEMRGKELFWEFQRVMYFQGPLHWQGADFRLGSDSECIELLAQLEPKVTHPEMLIEWDFCSLFKFKDKITGLDIKILAGGAFGPKAKVESAP